MSEPKPKNTNAASNAKGPQSKLRQSLKSLCCLAAEVQQEMDGFPKYETLFKSHKEMEQTIAAKDSEIQRLQQVRDTDLQALETAKDAIINSLKAKLEAAEQEEVLLFTKFEQWCKTHDQAETAAKALRDEVTKLNERLQKKQEELKTAQRQTVELKKEGDRVKKEVHNLQEAAAEAQRNCKLHAAQLESHKAELQTCKHSLEKLKHEAGEYRLVELDKGRVHEVRQSLDKFSQQCHSLTIEFFKSSDGTVYPPTVKKELRDHFSGIPISSSATVHSAQMRCALAQALIANVLVSRVFRAFFLPKGLQDPASIILNHIGQGSPRREMIYRCQMLAFSEYMDVDEDVISPAAEEVHQELYNLLLPTDIARFLQRLIVLFKDGLEVWRQVQHAKDLIIGGLKPEEGDEQPGRYEEYDHASSSKAIKPQPEQEPRILEMLFPQVVSDNEIIHPGIALWSNQPAAMAAAQELLNSRPNGSDLNRQGSSRRRGSTSDRSSATLK